MANAQAQATEHRQEMEAQRNARSKMEAEFEQRLKVSEGTVFTVRYFQ